MKKNIHKFALLAILVFSTFLNINAQEKNIEDLKSEIIEVSEKEINAFKSGDCQALDGFIDEKATFYMNGRKAPNKQMILGFCRQVQRPFEKPSLTEMEYMPISDNTAYVVRTMEFSKDEKIYKKEIVTKIWVKGTDGWKIMHLHSTISKL